MTALVIWLLVVWRSPGFKARWVSMPPSMSWATFEAARKASERPSFCKWNGPDTPCRVS